ncbi:MAG TPA: hypothetical protein PKE45_24620 [Caldilineaceae bacterium]|nr:hypothetical protein [Caldilineaceae bacterium]
MRFDNSPLFIGMQNDQVGQLHEILRLLEFPIPADELEQARFGEGTRLAVANFQTSRGLWPSGIVVDETAIRLPRLVRGQVRQANGAPLAGWIVRAFDRNLRQGDRPIGASTVSDETGHYQIAYEP